MPRNKVSIVVSIFCEGVQTWGLCGSVDSSEVLQSISRKGVGEEVVRAGEGVGGEGG